MRTVNSTRNSARACVCLTLSRRCWETEKEQIAKQMPSTQPRCHKQQEWGGHSQQPGTTGVCWLSEADRCSEKDRLLRELAVHLNKWSEQWGHAGGEAGNMLQSGTAAHPSTRPMRAVPKPGFGSVADEAGSLPWNIPLPWDAVVFELWQLEGTTASFSHSVVTVHAYSPTQWWVWDNYHFLHCRTIFLQHYLLTHCIQAGAQASGSLDKW